MIIYNGIKIKNKIPFISFRAEYDPNDKPQTIEIPIDSLTADRIIKYLNKICDPYHGLQAIEDQTD